MRTIWQFFLMRVRLLSRQREILFFIFVLPLMLMTGLALAFRDQTGPEVKAVVVGDPALAERLGADRTLVVESVATEAEAELRVRRGQVDALVLPGQPPRVVVTEGRPESKLAQLMVTDALERLDGRRPPAQVAVSHVRGAGTRYIDFLIPGMIGYQLLAHGLFSLGVLLVEMRVGRMLRRLKVSTVSRFHMLLGLVLGQLFQSLTEAAVMLGAAYVLFGVRCVGSLPLFLGFTVLSTICFGGIAVAMGARPRSMEMFQSVSHVMLMPVVLVSGVFFSAERFPAAIQPFLKLIPSRAAIDGMRAIFTEGAGLGDVLMPGLVVAAWGALAFIFGVRAFRWT